MHLTPLRDNDDRPSLWYHLLAGPAIWGAYFLIGYGLLEVACNAQGFETRILGLTVLSILILILTLAAAFLALVAGGISYRTWKAGRSNGPATVHDSPVTRSDIVEAPGEADENTARFAALIGVMLSGLFAFTILVTGLPALFLNPCGLAS